MGTGHVNENGGGDIGSNNGGSGGYCDMSYYSCIFSSGFIFFFGCFVFFESIAILYGWLTFLPAVHMGLSTVGCQEDNKGSWSIEIFYGESPFTLKPMKSMEDVFEHNKTEKGEKEKATERAMKQ
ncbi:hypothetical protein Ahy_B02g058745 isoform B [Arachis hypogaea]|uniref:Glucosamine inositolphosphorylceramide transferase 1 N-terminal domain-containing protein n=1 Tax=Arachis hypogaea TaxID=3818 RepID=A0A445AFC9_ARAHY|nr:hypothetical protein Ahy_B02g058745 isoform B [Arachis hypogaea]